MWSDKILAEFRIESPSPTLTVLKIKIHMSLTTSIL